MKGQVRCRFGKRCSSDLLGSQVALRRVQQRHRVVDRDLTIHVPSDLQGAPGVAGGDRGGLGGGEVGGLALAELGRGFRLHEVVDPGRAAADLPLVRLDQLEAGNRTQELARRRAPALGGGGGGRGGGGGWRGSWWAPFSAKGWRTTRGSQSASSSLTSLTLALNASARSLHSGSS